ncbi:MAG: hypothetical protein ACXVH3_20755 [Solirubrobacteraceae bacterium]
MPAFVIVGFLTLAGAYAIWAEPLKSREAPAAAAAAPPSPAAPRARSAASRPGDRCWGGYFRC